MTTPQQPPMRIGDVERDAASSALSEHYAAGRLTKPEYDERLETVWSARFDRDLRQIFADLPAPAGAVAPSGRDRPGLPRGPWAPGRRGFNGPGHPLIAVPLMLIALGALAFLVIGTAPWLFFIAFWFVVTGGFGRFAGHRHTHLRHQA